MEMAWPFKIEWLGGTLGEPPESSGSSGFSQNLLFDIASLTKVVATSTLLVEAFRSDNKNAADFCSQSLTKMIPELKNTFLERVPLQNFWEHQSALPAHIDFFDPPRLSLKERKVDRETAIHQAIAKIAAQKNIEEAQSPYSDLGYFLLGVFLERSKGRSLQELWAEWRTRYLPGVSSLRFFSELATAEKNKIVATESDRHPAGEVNDDNAYSLGQFAAHAGLTSTAKDLWQWLETVFILSKQHSEFSIWLNQSVKPGKRFVYGWDTPTFSSSNEAENNSTYQTRQSGHGAPPLTRGHLGYTGTALWFDPQSKKAGILLTNRVFPRHSSQNQQIIRELRTEFFSCLWQNESLERQTWLKTVQTRHP